MPIYLKTYNLSKVKSIPEDTYQWCLRNNFQSGRKADHGNISSCIRAWLIECVEEGKGILFVAHDGYKHLGWGLTYKYHDGFRNTQEFQVYVPPRNRRRGIGTKILTKACSLVGRVKVYAHTVSEDFYTANGLTTAEAITGKRLKRNNKQKV
jgi:GNAT superfamily N-acetyltransferase